MNFERFVAARYFKAKRRGLFTLITTGLGVAGVTIGVTALVTTLSVMNGFQSDIEKKVVGAQAHVTVHGRLDAGRRAEVDAALAQEKAVVATSPFVLGQAIVTHAGRSSGVVLKGLDPDREFKVNDLAHSLSDGSWEGLKPRAPRSAKEAKPVPGIVLGVELAHGLAVILGDEVVLVSPQGLESPLGLIPRMKRFRVTGLLRTGYFEFDNTMAYALLGEAAAFLGVPEGLSGVQAKLSDLRRAEEVAGNLQTRLGYSYAVRSYKQLNRTLFEALRLEKFVMLLLLTLITLVASFNITSNLILLGTEKLLDIGLFKAMGATPAQIRRIFLWEGLLIGALGVGLGLVSGLGLCAWIRYYPPIQLPADIYYLSQVPVSVEPLDLALVAIIGLALALLSALYPALRAARASPMEAIRDV